MGTPWITRMLADGRPALYYRAPVPDGVVYAMKRGSGPRALLLHGGPGLGAESIFGLLDELLDTFEAVVAQQRGLEPSTLEGRRDIETHVADQIALLDFLGWEDAWLIGHDWGGHLAMHLAVTHPDRVKGLILVATLGAVPDGGSGALVENLVARLDADERARLDPLVARQASGEDETDLWPEITRILWPSYNHDHSIATPAELPRIEPPVAGEPTTVRFDRRSLREGDADARSSAVRGSCLAHSRRRRPPAAERFGRDGGVDPRFAPRDHRRVWPLPLDRAAGNGPRVDPRIPRPDRPRRRIAPTGPFPRPASRGCGIRRA